MSERFDGTADYVATDDLKIAVNAAIALERPLLIKGEPGTGKTVLAEEIARALAAPLITWHIKSTTKAQQGLYEYDAVARLRDSQLGDAKVADIRNYIQRGKLWEAFVADAAPVLLIDEIDKADIEFPNDLLLELDRMEFYVYETRETVVATQRPIVLITSNNEKELPDAILRRCFFNYIRKGRLWEAFESPQRPVLLIDEIDKADIEFPNDLLLELDRMEFYVYETRETVRARQRPIVVITSNNEKELPDAFLRRCFFQYIRFPDRETMERIVDVHFPNVKAELVREALNVFYSVREVPGLKKKPSTSELLDWLKLLMSEEIGPEVLRAKEVGKVIPPLYGALLKNEQDVHQLERIAFLARAERRN
jgi:MoxR-like ATPase